LVTAYVTISSELGSEDDIRKELSSIEGVRETHVVYGVYDIVAVVEAESSEELNQIVFNKIRKINRVKSTLTLIVVE
jgi:DNA-binding Lrp family transcriptional regulator